MSNRKGLVWQMSSSERLHRRYKLARASVEPRPGRASSSLSGANAWLNRPNGRAVSAATPSAHPRASPPAAAPARLTRLVLPSPASPRRNSTEYSPRLVASTVAETAASAVSRSNSATCEGVPCAPIAKH